MAAMGAQTAADVSGATGAGAPAVGGGGGSWAQPAPLAFDIREIERFRYRVEDTLKKVRTAGVRDGYRKGVVHSWGCGRKTGGLVSCILVGRGGVGWGPAPQDVEGEC